MVGWVYIKKETKIDDFPKIKSHLEKFKSLIENIRRNDGEIWYSIVRPRKKEVFSLPKIAVPQRSKTNTFGYNESDFYCSSDVYFITQPKNGYSLKFLLGVLNSHLIYKWLYNRGKRKGEMLELYQEPLSCIPIPILDTPNKQEIARQIEVLVEEILRVKSENSPSVEGVPSQDGGVVSHNLNLKTTSPNKLGTPQEENLANTNHLELQIDQLVYRLYDLSEGEIGVIEE